MSVLLSFLQKQNIEALQLELDPNATWLLKVDHGSAGVMQSVINWSQYLVPTENKLLAQRLLLNWWSPSEWQEGMVISATSYRQASTLLSLFALLDEFYPDVSMCKLREEDWAYVFVSMLFYVWGEDPDTGLRKLIRTQKPLAKQRAERTMTVLKAWFDSYQKGEVSDGPEFGFTVRKLERYLRADFKQHDTDYDAWKTGGSYGAIPFVVAHLLLADALSTLRSYRARQLLAFFRVVREKNGHDFLRAFWSATRVTKIGRYRMSGDASILTRSIESEVVGGLANATKEILVSPLHDALYKLHLECHVEHPFRFPWLTYRDFLTDYNDLQAAIFIIFLSSMGKRGPSEVRTLRVVDITRPDASIGQNALVRPSIRKTNLGLREEQGVTNFIDDAVATLLQLGYTDKAGTNLPLFSVLSPLGDTRRSPKVFSSWAAHERLNNYYDVFCRRMENSVDFDVKGQHEKISSHQFRHSFAEFALRRFDGNVEELIRQHFCHSYNHWWTKRYTADKLDEDQINEINRRYISELVPRILYDRTDDPDFVGGIALYIKKQFADVTRVTEPSEAEEVVESICEDIIQITPHEYGWCLLHRDFRSVARCRDVNGTPNPSSTSAEKCTGCPNFCASRSSHLAKQTQLVLSHLDFIEQKFWTFPFLEKKSREAIRNAQMVFPELREYGEV